MVKIRDVRISNSTFKESKEPGLVALFVGATSGIGQGTLEQFAKNAYAPKVYVVGRSKSAATPLLNKLELLNPQATFVFIETEISLIKNVDKVSDEIKSKEEKLDILFMSPNYLSLGGRQESSEGIDIPHCLRYYTRLRFTYTLLPLLTASPRPRVISILAGGTEGTIDLTDLEVRTNFNTIKAAVSSTTQTTLALEELAKSYPSVTFIHKYPGLVNTGILERMMTTASGIYAIPAFLVRWLILPIVNFFSTTPDEAGERGLFIATSARYPPAEPKTASLGVPLPKGVSVARSSVVGEDGKGNGVYRLGPDDESAPDGTVLPAYRAEGAGKIVWESTLAVWERALARSG